MAVAFEVKGKSEIRTGAAAGVNFAATANIWGQTDADDLIQYEENIHERKIHTNLSGPELVGKVINLGRSGIIRFGLIEFDATVIDALLKATGASTIGQIGTLGADTILFALSIVPATAGVIGYTFPQCRIVDTTPVTQWGLIETKRAFIIEAMPNPASTLGSTEPLYFKQTVS